MSDRREGERIRALRHAMGLSRDMLSQRAFVSYDAIRKAENGAIPQDDTLDRLAEALHTTRAYLRTGSP